MTAGAEAPPPVDSRRAEPGVLLVGASMLLFGAFAGWYVRGLMPSTGPAEAPGAPLVVGVPPPGAGAGAVATAPRASSGRPDIVLVTVGSLRPDHLPLYQYGRPTMPWLSEMARESGQAFHLATAASSSSLSSAVSLLTGQLPSVHGILRPPKVTGPGRVEVPVLPEGAGTLAERLTQAGYQTWAVVSDPFLLPEIGLDRGFEHYMNVGTTRAQRVQSIVERIGVERRKSDKPLFAWIHYSDPSDPYLANPWAYGWGPPMKLGPDGRTPIPPDSDARSSPDLLNKLGRLSAVDLLKGGLQVGPELEVVKTLYDSELRLVDDHLQLLSGDLGVDDGDVFVVVGLNGEELLDHGGIGHGRTLHEEEVRVPLVISWPSTWPKSRRIGEHVSLVDLVPTLAEIGGGPLPDDGRYAKSLLPLLRGETWTRGAPVVSELGTKCRVVYAGPSKLVIDGVGPPRMYDISKDPRETNDISAQQAQPIEAMLARLEATKKDTRATTKVVEVRTEVTDALGLIPANPGPCD